VPCRGRGFGEQAGCAVTYHGIVKGFEDLGRDVIAETALRSALPGQEGSDESSQADDADHHADRS
jgi:hypothetical protein